MSAYQQEHQDRTGSLRLDFQKRADTLLASKSAASSYEAIVAEANVPQFPYRVLVADDEPSIREAIGAILESQGYEVLTVADGLDGLNALSGSLPDVIISDLHMPRMSGFEFLATWLPEK